MTLSEKDCDALKGQMPLYVKGLLTASQAEEFEKALTGCPELKRELAVWGEIHEAYKLIGKQLPEPSGRAYSRILKKIEEKKTAVFFKRFMLPTPVFIGVIAAQLLVIIALAVYVAGLKPEFKTLAAPSPFAYGKAKINVVFNAGASEAEIRGLLLKKIDGRIIDGPFNSGLYIIEISSQGRLDSALEILRKDKIVIMAEKAY